MDTVTCATRRQPELLKSGVPFATVAQISGWSASTTVRMLKRRGHIRPEAQREAFEAVATPEIRPAVNQIDSEAAGVLQSSRAN